MLDLLLPVRWRDHEPDFRRDAHAWEEVGESREQVKKGGRGSISSMRTMKKDEGDDKDVRSSYVRAGEVSRG